MNNGQIIIVRRSGGEEDGHHGGVWKIAFADFMTALMAFFLVMWLTSVSDDATKKQIAQYFNPIKLNSSTPPTKGLSTGDSGTATTNPADLSGPAEETSDPSGKPVGGAAEGGEDQALFRDPYAVLAEIAAESGPGKQAGTDGGVPDGSGLPGLNGGDAYRDPFDPASWQLAPNTAVDAAHPGTMKPAEFDAPSATTVELTPTADARPATAPQAAAPPEKKADAAAPPAGAPMSPAAEALKAEIRETVAATDPAAASGVEVSEGDGTVTISLADSLQSGMFEIGSAKPRADTVRLMEKIAAILSKREGSIVIRGHTDARPYAKGGYDNWRLSTARAHMAYYMLSRGGLDEKRVESIEGFADREPKNPADPNAAANRRIEILLKEPRA